MSFDRLAPHYSWMEKVLAGSRLQRCRVAWLEALTNCDRILIAGVGHGHFLRTCARRFPEARLTGVDASAPMLAHAQRRARNAGIASERLEFVHARLPQWRPPSGQFDAIVTPFFLDCFPPRELGAIILGLAESARPAARWLLSDFTVPARGLARQRARLVHALMYNFFHRAGCIRARRLTDPSPFLTAVGFVLQQRRHFEWGLLHSDLWERGGTSVADSGRKPS